MSYIRTTILLMLMSAVSAGAAPATTPALPPSKELLDARPENFKLSGASTAMADATIADMNGPDGGRTRGWRVDVRERAKEPWAIQLAAPITRDVPKRGDVVLLTVWA